MDAYWIFFLGLLLLYIKWIVILIILPFQMMYGYIRRRWSKDAIPFVYKILGAPYYLWERLFRDGWSRYMLYQVGMIPSCHLRRFFYKALGGRIGKNVVFHFRLEVRNLYKLQIGDGCIIGDNAILDARNGLVIGENVNLSSNVSVYTDQHDYRDPYFSDDKSEDMSVVIGDRAWLGSNVVILPGVKVGEGAVCCSGCVVTKDVAPYAVVAGVPAKKVNERPRDLRYVFDGKSCRLY